MDCSERIANQKFINASVLIRFLKVELTEVRGEIKTLDEKLSGQITTLDTKVEQLDKRIANQEFINASVLIGLILAFVGSVVSMFSNNMSSYNGRCE